MSSLNPPIRDWSNQRVWVLGASSGSGKALADALLAKGARVAVSARRAEVLAAAFGAQPNALQLPLDIADNASMQGALGQIAATRSPPSLTPPRRGSRTFRHSPV